MKLQAVCILTNGKEIVLGQMREGLGAGYWNVPGGHIDPGETAAQTAARETAEELKVSVQEKDLQEVGSILFTWKNGKQNFVRYFMTTTWSGEPQETAELANPRFFAHHEIPFHQMFPADKHFFPRLLAGEKLKGEVFFTGDGGVEKYTFTPTEF